MTWVLITNEEAEAMIACEHPTLDESVSLEVEYGSQSIQIFDLTCPDCGFIHSTMYSDVTLEDSKAHCGNFLMQCAQREWVRLNGLYTKP